ncbi:maleylpyruvate isomerase family mycothiol-dependent enzyme [Aeromicrobium duanguangcaii]|uniref:Maleylpyruvate isomerase family mycothiol-dependent enzyme n=1 Tax=Aeromicrobium duanguangcaii TaxID=2968086 RepID=A0ABY5KD01_9ACTN|nr:maleylpyruvate isomerase family mycothiol-dependent enzyme [Aeromicrobium duanguangcaii]MCD9155391.1 maleylpyruvate isomerase family mycothiol-dependent enzyme [Aeromicrobium duanguangcaii]MCL3838359.1 maleylpyruvate isomerase family mycothiol-dependent enzyme [Aeromicrobium duanguangcaii]UUI68337.1 maleylpyruvate isomerase family mycothiol-dependent enzyme [Aeromicrobium duanguangcaii]
MTDLSPYLDAWRQSVAAVLALEPDNWDVPTDLPGWTAKDVLAHLVHLERVMVEGETTPVGGAAVPGDYTDAGVAALRDVPVEQLKKDLTDLVERRAETLAELPDPQAMAVNTPAGVEWTWEVALRNRAIDLWTHEQDIRRAVGIPGGLDDIGAHVTTATFAAALPYILGRRAKAPIGSVVRWIVTGPVPVDATVEVGEDGRARRSGADPTTTLTMDTEAFTVLGGGRRGPDDVTVEVDGDPELAARVLGAMAVTT